MSFYSRSYFTGDGSTRDFTVGFPYLDKTHVKVFLNFQLTTAWAWVNSTTIRFNTAPSSGVAILLSRKTSPTSRLVDYSADTSFTEADLDKDSLQAFYLAQEATDQANLGLAYDPSSDNFSAFLSGTSSTSITIQTGSQTFTTQAGKQWQLGQRIRAASSDGSKIVEGEITSYQGVTLQITADYVEGSGTYADWYISIAGARGSPGDAGDAVTGPQGVPGQDGRTIYSGSGAPSSGVGANGDFYIDTTAHSIYGPKTAGAWGSGVSLIGPTGSKGDKGDKGDTGSTGAQGDPGNDGATWYSGSGAPSDGDGADGDFYLRTSNSTVYGKSGGSWSVLVVLKGDTGDAGADGYEPGYQFIFSTTTTDADPGDGKVRFNNATFASITSILIDDLDGGGNDVTDWFSFLDDSTNTVKGVLRFQKAHDPYSFAEFSVTGSPTNGTGYHKVPVSPVNGAIFSNTDAIVASFIRAGDKGSDGVGTGDVVGPSSVTDGRPALFDGTTGKLLKQHTAALGALAVKDSVGATDVDDNAVTDTKLRQSSGLSVIGRSANSTGNVADITAGTDGYVLRRSGTSIGWGLLVAANITDAVITYAKMASAAIASAANYMANAASVILTPNAVWSAAAPVNLGSKSGNVSLDFSTFINAKLATTANITFNAASNVKKGQKGTIEITLGGAHTLSLNSTYFVSANGSGITLSSTSGDINVLSYAALDSGKVLIAMGAKAVA